MQQRTVPCLWFNNQAEEAANFYTGIFKHSGISNIAYQNGMALTVSFMLEGLPFLGLNGGPAFKPNPSISFFVTIEDKEELQGIWDKLLEGGTVLMALDKYDWSEKYGWIEDKFGVSWQLFSGSEKEAGQKIVPLFMFCGTQEGRAEEAIHFYTSLFKKARINSIDYYTAEQQTGIDARVVHARFELEGNLFMAMDSHVPQNFSFTEGISIIVNCDTQDEIDYYWEKLSADGGKEVECGWLKDKYGLSWQIVPTALGKLMSGNDKEKSKRVMQAILKMKKLDIAQLEKA